MIVQGMFGVKGLFIPGLFHVQIVLVDSFFIERGLPNNGPYPGPQHPVQNLVYTREF